MSTQFKYYFAWKPMMNNQFTSLLRFNFISADDNYNWHHGHLRGLVYQFCTVLLLLYCNLHYLVLISLCRWRCWVWVWVLCPSIESCKLSFFANIRNLDRKNEWTYRRSRSRRAGFFYRKWSNPNIALMKSTKLWSPEIDCTVLLKFCNFIPSHEDFWRSVLIRNKN